MLVMKQPAARCGVGRDGERDSCQIKRVGEGDDYDSNSPLIRIAINLSAIQSTLIRQLFQFLVNVNFDKYSLWSFSFERFLSCGISATIQRSTIRFHCAAWASHVSQQQLFVYFVINYRAT